MDFFLMKTDGRGRLGKLFTFKRKKKLYDKLVEQDSKLKTLERRYYEALRDQRNVITPLLNDRNHWQQKPLRDQARHLYENDPIARRVVDSIVCNMIGKGVTPTVSGISEYKVIVDRFFSNWMSSTDGDYFESNTLTGLQSLIVRCLVRDGSVFVRRNIRRKKLTLEVLEGEYLNVKLNGIAKETGNVIYNGIEFADDGKILAYHLFSHHPDNFSIGNLNVEQTKNNYLEVTRVPVTEVCHVKRLDRAGQLDGFSWLAPALESIWDLKEYEEAKLKQQKLQASYTAFVQDNFELSEEEREDIIGMEDKTLATDDNVRAIEPGFVEELPPGKTITFPNPTVTPHEAFVERALRRIAGSLGVSYEIFNDYSNVNFSSGRMGFLEMNRHIRHQLESTIIPQCFMRISKWVITHLEVNGQLPPNNGIRVRWSPEAAVMIDPEKEIKSLQNEVSSNFISMREAMSRLGYDFEKTLDEIKESNEKLDQYGISGLTYGQGGAVSREFLSKINKSPMDNTQDFKLYSDIEKIVRETDLANLESIRLNNEQIGKGETPAETPKIPSE